MSNLDSSGRHAHTYNMGEVTRSMCAQTGIHQCLDLSFIKIDKCIVTPQDDVDSIQTRLKAAAENFHLKLTPMQLKSVYSVVRRPKTSIVVKWAFPDPKTAEFRSRKNDSGSPVLMDLPTGMGKTITCLLSCLLLTTERRVDMMASRTSSFSARGCEIFTSGDIVNGGRVSMVFAPKHLHGQWVKDAARAKSIVEKMYEEGPLKWEVVVESNKKASSLELGENQAAVIICDCSAFGPIKALESDIGYSALCYDECAEGSTATTNAARSRLDDNVFYGRIIFCSADFSKLYSTFGSCPETCAMKVALGIHDRAAFGVSIKSRFSLDLMTDRQASQASTLTAVLSTAAVLPGDYRETVLRDSCALLGDTQLYTLRMPYQPTLMERLRGAAGSDVNGAAEGALRFSESFGVDISDCQTIGDIVSKLQSTERMKPTGVPGVFKPVLPDKTKSTITALREMVGEECPICMENFESSCIIQPCLHMVCNSCMQKLVNRDSCPMCRGKIRGSVATMATSTLSKKRKHDNSEVSIENMKSGETSGETFTAVGEASGETPTLGNAFFSEMRKHEDDIVSVSRSLKCVLGNLKKASILSGRKTLRVMVICSHVDIEEGNFSEGYDVVPYVTLGTRENPSRRKKLEQALEAFQADDGRFKLLLCKDSVDESDYNGITDDDMTGLDFPTLQAVVSLGSSNRAQRVGRLCRLSRMGLDRHERDAVYVELYKNH